MDRGAWRVTVHRGCKESDTTEATERAHRESDSWRQVVTRGWGQEWGRYGELVLNGYSFSLARSRVLEMDGGDGCTTF